jgi:cyanate permease
MAAIAFLSNNLAVACVYAAYSVLIGPIEAKLGVTRDLSSLGLPLVSLAIALTAPLAGVLDGKVSLRLLMGMGELMLVTGLVVAGVTHNIVVYLVAYGLLIGPGLCLTAIMLPSTLVTRWYNVNRGRTLGIVNMPILGVIMPSMVAVAVRAYGPSTTYFLLAGLMALLLPALFFVVDYPPNAIDPSGEDMLVEVAAHPGMSVGDLLRAGRFWALTLTFAAVMTSGVILAAHLVPMVIGWGVDMTKAAGLLGATALGGIAGSLIFGWIADRLGGASTLVLLCVNSAILWAILLLRPPFAVLLPLAALLGAHAASVIAVIGMAFSQRFGQASFARAFGVSNLLNLPIMVLGVPLAAYVYVRTGSYAGALLGTIGFLLLGAVCAAMGQRASQIG